MTGAAECSKKENRMRTVLYLPLVSSASAFTPVMRCVRPHLSPRYAAAPTRLDMESSTSLPYDDVTSEFAASDVNEEIRRGRDSMPWSDIQQFALMDNLPKFSVIISSPTAADRRPQRHAMWRTLAREVPELSGYPISFLMEMHGKTGEDTPLQIPMIDDFQFEANGGMSGRAYGLPGVADGTKIQTPPIVRPEETMALGYVTTSESVDSQEVGFSYELGNTVSVSGHSLHGFDRSASLLAAQRLVMDGAAETTRVAGNIAKDSQLLLSDDESNRDLVYLGGATALLLASATAVGALSHHLTVNVFWV